MLKDHSFKISHLLFDTFLAVFLQSVRSLEVRLHFLVVVQKEQGSCASSLLPLLASRLEKVSLESCSPQKCERSRRSRILFPTNLRSESSVTHHQFCKQSPSIYLQSLAKYRIHMNNLFLGLLTKYNFVFGCILNKTLATVFTSLTFNEAEILQIERGNSKGASLFLFGNRNFTFGWFAKYQNANHTTIWLYPNTILKIA